jgi:hypothetical protein
MQTTCSNHQSLTHCGVEFLVVFLFDPVIFFYVRRLYNHGYQTKTVPIFRCITWLSRCLLISFPFFF